MKKRFLTALMVALCLFVSGCGVTKQTYDLDYGTEHPADVQLVEKYGELIWSSSDESIAAVGLNGTITANGPGTAVVKAMDVDKVVAEYTINVKVVPATNIVLSTNTTSMQEGETFTLSYSLFPDNASDYGINWRSADESVAAVNAAGEIYALKAGQTTISASNSDGIMATCSVTVELKAAYERLSDGDKEFVDCALKYIGSFKNPDSVVIRAIEGKKGFWTVKVSAQNGFGGTNTTVYFLTDTVGFWNYESFDLDTDVEIKPDLSFNIDLINEAIADKR